MLKIYKDICKILDRREKKLGVLVLLITTIVAVIDVLGVASIMPFMAVLINPEVIDKNPVLAYSYTALGFESKDAYLFFLGVLVFILLVGSTLLRGFLVWLQMYYANLRIYSISTRLVSGYLNKPYAWFLSNNGFKLTASIIEEVTRVVKGIIHPALRLITNSIIAILIVLLFMWADPTLAICIALILGFLYGLIYKFASSRLAIHGEYLSVFQQNRHKALQEAFGGIKDIKLIGLEHTFIDNYRTQARNYALKNVAIKLWAEAPAFGMQALVFGGMMLIILYLLKFSENLEQTIPTLALYALGGYKLMPAMQEIYRQIASIKGNLAAMDSIIYDLNMVDTGYLSRDRSKRDRLSIEKYFALKDLQYNYPGSNKLVLDGLNISVERNTTIGFVGGSGSGKTTTVDIILGLLQAKAGQLLVDDLAIDNNNMRSWQNNIGYVPQHIFLTDDSVAANIAFGIPKDKIDYAIVKICAQTANLDDFIENELPESYETHVGERGIRLSGGQRQRIGIARALYYDPELLILDEATSALDNITERVVMDAVNALGHKKTIIIVAHRLSTVETCDKIFLFENGRVSESGTYDELLKFSDKFKEMALQHNIENS